MTFQMQDPNTRRYDRQPQPSDAAMSYAEKQARRLLDRQLADIEHAETIVGGQAAQNPKKRADR